MAIEEQKLSEEDKTLIENKVKEKGETVKEKILSDNIWKTLDLGKDEGARVKTKGSATVIEDEEEEPDEDEIADDTEESEDEIEEEDEEESIESDEIEEEESEEDETLDDVAKRKVRKRISKLTTKNRDLEEENRRLREQVDQKNAESTKDSDIEKLDDIYEKHGADGVEQLQDEIMLAMSKLSKEETPENQKKIVELSKLNRKANRYLIEAPQRFVSRQITELQKSAIETQRKFGKERFEKILPRLKEYASTIYSRSASMQKSVKGQAEAWNLAVEHYRELRNPKDAQDETMRLKRQNNKLKMKTSLAGKPAKGGLKPKKDIGAMREEARFGNTNQKAAYVRERFDIDSLIPDHLKGG